MRALDRDNWRDVLCELFDPDELLAVKLLPPAMLKFRVTIDMG